MPSYDAPPTRDQVRRLVERLTEADGHEARAPIREQLRAFGPQAAPWLVEHLGHADCFTRWEMVSLLGELAEASTMEAVVAFALAEDEVHARWRSFWAVTRFPPQRTLPLLLDALADPSEIRRWRAALILSMLRRREAGPVLLQGLDHPKHWIRWEALSAIKSLRLPGVEDRLAAFLEPDHPRDLRQEAVLALGAIGSEPAHRLLEATLNDPEPEVRWRASMSLTRSDDPRWLAALRARLDREHDDEVRAQLLKDISYLENRHGSQKERAR